MAMKISDNKRVEGKFVDGFVSCFRVKANEAGGIRIPIATGGSRKRAGFPVEQGKFVERVEIATEREKEGGDNSGGQGKFEGVFLNKEVFGLFKKRVS